MKKAFILAIIFSTQIIFSACGAESLGTVETTSATTAPKTELVGDNLPDKDYNGYEFRMFIRNEDAYIADMWAETLNGDIMNDAIYERNSKVAECFNIIFKMIRSADSSGNDAGTAILAGEDAYDLLVCSSRTTFNYAHKQLLMEWNTRLPYIDLDREWWNQDSRKSFSIYGKLYTCVGDISYLNIGASDAMLFNKKMLEDIGVDDIYDTVRAGEWTLDEFGRLVKQGSRDLNGDNKIDISSDQFGYITHEWIGPIQALYSGGQRICGKNDEDELILSLNSQRTVDIFEKYFVLCENDAVHVTGISDEINNTFIEDRCLFVDNNVRGVASYRNMKTDFGIVPWPKFDSSDERYYANVDAGCNLISVPITASDPERTSIIIEALCFAGNQSVIPAYYETVLQTKYSRDDDSVQMLDLIYEGRVLDIGYYYNFSSEFSSIGHNLWQQTDRSFTSYYAKYESKALASIQAINEIYR